MATLCFSANGRYILTMDEERTRIWSADYYHGYDEKKERPVEEITLEGRPVKLERPELLPAPNLQPYVTPPKKRYEKMGVKRAKGGPTKTNCRVFRCPSEATHLSPFPSLSLLSPSTSSARPLAIVSPTKACLQADSSYRSSDIVTSPVKRFSSPLKENRSPMKKLPK